MKKNLSWFTLIEIIVTISIVILLSSSWVFYFGSFIDSLKIKSDIISLKSHLEDLDKKIQNEKSYDYELYLKKDSLWFYYYENILNKPNKLKLISPPFNTWTGILELEDTNFSGSLEISISTGINIIAEDFFDTRQSFSLNMSKNDFYEISSSLSGSKINNVWVKYFSKKNLKRQEENLLVLEKILDADNQEIDEVIIKNIYSWIWEWSIKIIWDYFKKITLIFDNNWEKEHLVIR